MNEQDRSICRFGSFVLDFASRSLFFGDTPVSIAGKCFDLLVYFVRHPGVVLTKKELLSAAWPGVNVGEDNVDRQISTLRGILDKAGGDRDYIETRHGKGYIFLGDIESVALPRQDSLSLDLLKLRSLSLHPTTLGAGLRPEGSDGLRLPHSRSYVSS